MSGMHPYQEDEPTTIMPPAPAMARAPRMLGPGGRIAATCVAGGLLVAAGAGIGLFVADDSDGHAHDMAPSAIEAAAPSTTDGGAGSGNPGGPAAGDPDRKAWAQKYGQAVSQMPDLPDVASATPQQQAAAADLLARIEAGTAAFADVAAAKAAGYDVDTALATAENRQPRLRQQMQAVDAGQPPKRMPMLHVVNKANLHDGKVLDPSAPEALTYEYAGHNTWKLVGAAFTAAEAYPGAPPDPGGPITRWHYPDKGAAQVLTMQVFFVPGNDLAHAYALHLGAK